MYVNGGFYDANVGVEPSLEGDQLLPLHFVRRRLAVENCRPVSGRSLEGCPQYCGYLARRCPMFGRFGCVTSIDRSKLARRSGLIRHRRS